MIKQGIKNYFKSLKYFFTPLGTMFLGMMLGFSILLPGIVNAASDMITAVKQLADNIDLDVNSMFNQLWDSVKALGWESPLEAIKTMFTSQWLNEELTKILASILGTDFDTFKNQLVDIVKDFGAQVTVNIAIFIFFWILGFATGFSLVKFLIRRDIARRSLFKLVLANVLNSLLSSALVVLSLWLFTLWEYSIIISLILLLILVGIFALLEAYLIHGFKKIKLKDTVNAKNAGLYMLSNLIIFVISICLTLIAVAINKILGLFVGLSLVVIAFIVIELNAEAFVKSKADAALKNDMHTDEVPADTASHK